MIFLKTVKMEISIESTGEILLTNFFEVALLKKRGKLKFTLLIVSKILRLLKETVKKGFIYLLFT